MGYQSTTMNTRAENERARSRASRAETLVHISREACPNVTFRTFQGSPCCIYVALYYDDEDYNAAREEEVRVEARCE